MQKISVRLCKIVIAGVVSAVFWGSPVSQAAKTIDVSKAPYLADISGQAPASAAIQLAINAAQLGDTVYFPAGTYTIDAPITIYKAGITLNGETTVDGRRLAILKFNNSKDYYAQYSQNRVGILNVCANDITVSSLYLDQNFRGSGRVYGEPDATPLIGSIIMGCQYTGKAVRTSGIKILNNTAYDYYGDAISAFNASSSNFEVRGNRLVSHYIVGGFTESHNDKPLVHGQQAISTVGGDNITIDSNVIRGALDDAIALHNGGSNITVTANRITTTGGRILVSGAQHVTISGNHIRYIARGSGAIWITYSGESMAPVMNDDVSVFDNTITVDPGVVIANAIRLFGAGTNIRIHNNSIERADGDELLYGAIGLNDYPYKTEPDPENPALNKTYYYFGDQIEIYDNQLTNFRTGISYILYSGEAFSAQVDIWGNAFNNVTTMTFPAGLNRVGQSWQGTR